MEGLAQEPFCVIADIRAHLEVAHVHTEVQYLTAVGLLLFDHLSSAYLVLRLKFLQADVEVIYCDQIFEAIDVKELNGVELFLVCVLLPEELIPQVLYLLQIPYRLCAYAPLSVLDFPQQHLDVGVLVGWDDRSLGF